MIVRREGLLSSQDGKGAGVPPRGQLTKGVKSGRRAPRSFRELLWGNQGPSLYLMQPSPLLHWPPFCSSKATQSGRVRAVRPPPRDGDHLATSWPSSPKPSLSHCLHSPALKPAMAPHSSQSSPSSICLQPTLPHCLSVLVGRAES